MKSILLEPGTIITWKAYNCFTRLWNKIKGKKLPHNRFAIVTSKTELLTSKKLEDLVIYEPIRKYSRQETGKLQSITANGIYNSKWDDLTMIVNIVRPNTLFLNIPINMCRFYNQIEQNEKLDEYIY